MNENLNENNNVTPTVTETVVETPVTEPTITVPLEPKKKKKGLKGFIIFLIVVLIIGGLIFGGIKLYKHLTYVEDPFPDIDSIGAVTEEPYDPTNSFTNSIKFDYENGYINTDQYMMQLAYSIFDSNKLYDKYKSLDNDYANPRELFDTYEEKAPELSDETKQYIISKYFGDFIIWDTGDDNETDANKTTSSTFNYEVKKLSRGGSDAAIPYGTLKNVRLSSGGHFLLYFSTTGENAISEENAVAVGEHLEKVIKQYKKNYGLDYEYTNYYKNLETKLTNSDFYSYDPTLTPFANLSRAEAEKLLKNQGIDKKYLDTAMPLYFLNMGDANVPAFYTSASISESKYLDLNHVAQLFQTAMYDIHNIVNPDDIVNIQQSGTAAFTYAFPYIVINSGEEHLYNQQLIGAHELFHHYQRYICGDGGYEGVCNSGGFTIETTADMASVQNSGIDELGTSLTVHSAGFTKLSETSINKVGEGYGGLVFASNYTEVVPNGTNIMLQSVKYEDPLSYIYNSSNGKYRDALTLTAERLLTLDYKYKQLLPYSKGNSWSPTLPSSHGDINVNHRESINYSSMQYYYVDPSTLGESKIYFKAGEQTPHELTLLLFVKEDNKYKKVYSHNLDEKFVIKASDWTAYDEIAFSIVESSIYNDNVYYNLETSPNIKDEVTVTPKSLGLKEPDQSKRKANTIMCYQIEDTEYFKTGYQVLINLDKDQNIDNMLMKGTLKVKDNVIATKAFDIAKKTAPGILLGIKIRYKQMLKNVRITTTETDDSWTVLFKVTKDYDGAFTSTFGAAGNSKEEIINLIKAKGFTCE